MISPRTAACAIAVLVLCSATAASAAGSAPQGASVLLIWRLPAPQASAQVQPIEAGIVALGFLAPQLRALSRHADAKVTLALDPAYVSALQRAAKSPDVLESLASGELHPKDPATSELLEVVAANVVPAVDLQAHKVAARFLAGSATVRLSQMRGFGPGLAQAGEVDFVAAGLLLALQSAGYAQDASSMLDRGELTAADLRALGKEFAAACQDVLDRVRQQARAGGVELAALPAYEPILPLVIDAAGRTERAPFTVALRAGADAAAAVDDGLAAVAALDPSHGSAGVISPNGAYDDETVALLQAQRARYAVFSERVVKADVGAAASSVADARSAAFRAYLLETSKTATIPIFFCSDTASTAIDSQPLRAPASAMADRLHAAVQAAVDAVQSASSKEAPVVVLCLPATGSILHRADRAAALDAVAAALASPSEQGKIPRDFLSAHPPMTDTYGYEAASDSGDFSLWMGSANQVTLWNALDAARTAAGGDAAVTNPSVRDALLQAESGRFYLALSVAQPQYLTESVLAQFRELIAQIYRGAGQTVPRAIAPVKLGAQAPAASPAPAAPPPAGKAASPAPAATAAATASPGLASPSPAPSRT